jgi:hypothetical protein
LFNEVLTPYLLRIKGTASNCIFCKNDFQDPVNPIDKSDLTL